MRKSLFSEARACLLATDVDEKLLLTRNCTQAWEQGSLHIKQTGTPIPVDQVGRPRRPVLVPANKVPRRGIASPTGKAVMIHAIAHIEFNAINLALDAVQRFPEMPHAYYDNWIHIADEEAHHFALIRTHLQHLGADYGDYDAHNGLWEMCEKTAHDVMVRMALIPKVLEARGLDVTPAIQKKLIQAGDHHAAELLDVILQDEIGHVKTGNDWFLHCCETRSLNPEDTFSNLLNTYYPKGLSGPFNLDARKKAGFSDREMMMFAEST